MLEAVRLMRERVEEMAIAMTLEQGKPIAQSRLEILRGCDIIEWDAQKGRRIYGRIIPSEPGMRHSVLRQPIGVVAAFSPWNFPIAARQGMRALLPPDRQIAGDALELLLGHQWPDLRLRITPVTDAQRLAERGDTADELIVDLVLDEQARAGAADLPGIGKHG
ncbi:MAG: aldehyde dehydrogenase family protein, partial [Acetobacteraceae bacterium]